jgi:hypothetical protein
MKNNIRFYHISLSSSKIKKCFRQKQHKIKTHISCSKFFFENREIMWKNMEETDRPQMTIWGMRIACCIPKVTNKHIRIHNKIDI